MSKRVKVAIAGAGWWATEAHIPAIIEHPDAELVGVLKRSREKAERLAADFGVPHGCSDIDDLLGIDGLDAVIVSSTPNMHYSQTRAALERGLHVLIEKPMTITAAEARELAAMARERGLHFLISCPWHYTAHSRRARELVRGEALGTIRMISVLMTNFSGGLYAGKSWAELNSEASSECSTKPYYEPGRASYSDPAVAGGGHIYTQVSHPAAYIGFLTGARPAEVFARFENVGIAVDMYDVLNLKLSDGSLVSLASTGATMKDSRHYELRIYGSEGMILQELWQGTMSYHKRSGAVEVLPALAGYDIYPAKAPAIDLVDTILGRSDNGAPVEDGVFAMEIIEASCRSATENRNIALEVS